MRGVKRSCREEPFAPFDASFVIFPTTVRISDGVSDTEINSSTVERSQILSEVQREASVDGCRVPTRFPAEQLRLWVTYTRMPRVFLARGCLLNTLAVLEVADMLNDSKSLSTLCDALARDHIAPLACMLPNATRRARPPHHTPASAAATSGTPGGPSPVHRRHTRAPRSRANLNVRRRCMQPQPCMAIRDAYLWGMGLTLGGLLTQTRPFPPGGGGTSDREREKNRRSRREPSKLAVGTRQLLESAPPASTSHAYGVSGPGPGGDVELHAAAVRKALEALPEHLLLRVLRSWDAPVATQLAALPPRMHPAALAAAHPSIAADRSVSVGGFEPRGTRLFDAALRAAATLASTRHIDSITITPLSNLTQDCEEPVCEPPPLIFLVYKPPPLHLLTRHLRHLSGLTSLAIEAAPAVLSSTNMHALSCITPLPRLRRVRIADVAMPALPALVDTLARMERLRELHLGIFAVPLLVNGDWGGAAVAGRHLSALTGLEAVNLKLAYKPLHFRGRTYTADRVAPLLRELANKQVEISSDSFQFEGTRRPAGVLGVLRAAAPTLDLSRCSVEESGRGETHALSAAEVETLWAALMAQESGADIALCLVYVLLLRDGMALTRGQGTVGMSPALLGSLPGLEGLSLAFHQPQLIDRTMAMALGRRLHRLTRLKELNFGLSEFGEGTARLLLPRLAPLTALQHLDLKDVCMGPDGAEALATALPALSALTRLRLQGNAIDERGGVAVMAALAPGAAAGMQELRLAWTGLGPAGAVALAARLPEMTSLRELDLCGNGMAGGLVALLEGLGQRLPTLTRLDLAENSLECSDAVAVACMLPRLPNLHRLILGWNKIGAVGARALARQIVCMPNLGQLDLQNNCIGDVGATALARALRRYAPRDQPLCVSYVLFGCGIRDAGALALASAFYRVCAEILTLVGRDACQDRGFVYVTLNGNEICGRVGCALEDSRERWARQGLRIDISVNG